MTLKPCQENGARGKCLTLLWLAVWIGLGSGQVGAAEGVGLKSAAPADTGKENRTVPNLPVEEVTVKRTLKTVSGEVSAVSRRFLAVVHKKTKEAQYETAFNVGHSTEFRRVKRLQDLKFRDVVEVAFEEVVERPGEPGERTSLNAKVVTLLKSSTTRDTSSREGPR